MLYTNRKYPLTQHYLKCRMNPKKKTQAMLESVVAEKGFEPMTFGL